MFEYMGIGKAIIASDLEQIGEILEHEKTAYLVPPGNINALADAMRIMANDKVLRDELGKNARQEVITNLKELLPPRQDLVQRLGEVRIGLCYVPSHLPHVLLPAFLDLLLELILEPALSEGALPLLRLVHDHVGYEGSG